MMLTDTQKDLLVAAQQGGGRGHLLTLGERAITNSLVDQGLLVVSPSGNGDFHAFTRDRGSWPVWAIEHFPDPEETDQWEPLVWHYALHGQVLAVAKTRIEGAWKAYCANVPGHDCSQEEQYVLDFGNQITEAIALAIFPHMKGIPYAS